MVILVTQAPYETFVSGTSIEKHAEEPEPEKIGNMDDLMPEALWTKPTPADAPSVGALTEASSGPGHLGRMVYANNCPAGQHACTQFDTGVPVCIELMEPDQCPLNAINLFLIDLPNCLSRTTPMGSLCNAANTCDGDEFVKDELNNCQSTNYFDVDPGPGGEKINDTTWRIITNYNVVMVRPHGVVAENNFCANGQLPCTDSFGNKTCIEPVSATKCPCSDGNSSGCGALSKCDKTSIGELCEADLECYAPGINNCPGGYDVYRVLAPPPPVPQPAPPPKKKSFPGWAIALIVVLSLLVVVAAVLVYKYKIKAANGYQRMFL